MHEIHTIYSNAIGIAFQWQKDVAEGITDQYQLVFRDMGFRLTLDEIKEFSNHIQESKEYRGCSACNKDKDCKSILLRTPSFKIDLAVNKSELQEIDDLVSGTLFQLDLQQYLNKLSLN